MREVPRTTPWGPPARIVLALCASLGTDVAIAAPPTLQSVAVIPAASSISVGDSQLFKATGTFSNGSTRVLGPAIYEISLGLEATCALLVSGGVKCWGSNSSGQLGDGSYVDLLRPRRVKGIAQATALAFQGGRGCVVRTNGTVRCWGLNANGPDELGPVTVTGINSATAVAVGVHHSCTLLANGAVQCWGGNYYGTLGDGTNADSSVPVSVEGISTAIGLASLQDHTCARLASGAVQCWGSNEFGQLGNGTTADSNKPVTVFGIDTATAIAAGAFFNCALLSDGSVRCWGHGGIGELGDGRRAPHEYSSTPVQVALIGTAVEISAGAFHACAVMSSGDARCWGFNEEGELGNSAVRVRYSNTPVQVRGVDSPARLAAGGYHTCALLANGAMQCWGSNQYGQLGNGRKTVSPTRLPVNVVGTPGVVWDSSDPTKATIRDSGRAIGRSIGNTTITATTAGFINDNAVLTVK
jgi:alpha-tubulin suppressor-like RCC1 family protein